MAWRSDDIYRSSNGDHWQLLSHSPSGQMLVRHTPTPSSGGRVSDLPVETFLAIDGAGPEHHRLRAVLRTLSGL